MTKYEKFTAQILQMHKDGYQSKEISDELNIDSRRVSEILIKNGYNSKGNVNDEVKFESEFQRDVFMGTLLGDGCLFKCEKGVNYRFNLAHSMKQKEYFVKKYDIIKELMQTGYFQTSQLDRRTNKTYKCVKVQSLTNPFFTKLYDKWYYDGKKKIKEEILEYSKPFYAAKYFDDGCYQKNNKTFEISMCNYDKKSCEILMSALDELYNVKTTLQAKNVIYVLKRSADNFLEVVNEFATSDVLYKLGENGENLQSR